MLGQSRQDPRQARCQAPFLAPAGAGAMSDPDRVVVPLHVFLKMQARMLQFKLLASNNVDPLLEALYESHIELLQILSQQEEAKGKS